MDLINSTTSKVVIKEIVLRTIENHIHRLKDIDLQNIDLKQLPELEQFMLHKIYTLDINFFKYIW